MPSSLVAVKFSDFSIDRLTRLKKYKYTTVFKLGNSLIVELASSEICVTKLSKELGCKEEKISIATDSQKLAFETAVEKRLSQSIGEQSWIRGNPSLGPSLTSSPKPKVEKVDDKQNVKVQQGCQTTVEEKESKMSSEQSSNQKVIFEIPVIDTSSNEALENSIIAIELAKEFEMFSEQKLIFQILVKSKMTNLFRSLSAEQRKDINSFVAFLRECFGDATGHAAWERYRNIKQGPNESPLLLFQRVKNSYYGIRGKTCPEKVPDQDQLEITETFVSAIKDGKVQCLLRQNSDSIDFDKLGLTARNYAKALNVEVTWSVNQIDSKIDKLAETVQVLTLERNTFRNRERSFSRDQPFRSSSRGRTPSRDRRYDRGYSKERRREKSSHDERERPRSGCFRCGLVNHKASNCWASKERVDSFRMKVQEYAELSDEES